MNEQAGAFVNEKLIELRVHYDNLNDDIGNVNDEYVKLCLIELKSCIGCIGQAIETIIDS